LKITLNTRDWGGASEENIVQVLSSSQRCLDNAFGNSLEGVIIVVRDLNRDPMTRYERGPNGEYFIHINTGGMYWAQYAYQFSHEYCHIRSNYAQGIKRFRWFEESICELASIISLRLMSKEWEINPPYPNGVSFSNALYQYAKDIVDKKERQLMPDVSFKSWFNKELPILENNECIRDKNGLIANQLLPLFEADRSYWIAISLLNTWNVNQNNNITDFFDSWQTVLDNNYKYLIKNLRALFGV